MANKAKKDNKNLIIGICAAVVVVVVIIVAVVLATRGGSAALNDSYFVSDGSKYVLTLDTSEYDDEEYTPIKTHIVYFYSGDDITDMKAYYEFADENSASSAFNYYKTALSEEDYKDIVLDGKYVIISSNPADYEDLTAEDVKQQIEFMEMLQNMNFDEDDDSETVNIDVIDDEEE